MMRRILLVVGGVALLFFGAVLASRADVTIDLRRAGAVDVVLFGDDADDYFGYDMTTGDINGNGIADLIVGAPLADGPDNRRTAAGEVHIFFDRPANDWPAENPAPDVVVYGEANSNWLGGDFPYGPGLIAVGDLDHDGIGDLALGVPAFGWETQIHYRGKVYILWGQAEWPATIDLSNVPEDRHMTTITPRQPPPLSTERAFLGAAIATGDFNGDTVADLAMTSPGGADGDGAVHVLLGAAGSTLRDRAISLGAVPGDIATYTIIGPMTGSRFGSYVAFGQWSGDDQVVADDLAVATEHLLDADGRVDVIFGGPVEGETRRLATQPADWLVLPEQGLDRLGSSLAAGDLDADGQADLIIGARSADGPAGAGTGQAIVIFGPLPQATVRDLSDQPGDLIIYGPQGGADQSYLGESTATGDWNGDGYTDLLVGARQANGYGTRDRGESGIVYLFYGPMEPGVIDLAHASANVTLVGAYARDFTGIVTMGDITGDGIDDLITGAAQRDGPSGKAERGAAYILFGSNTEPTAQPTLTSTATPVLTATLPVQPTATVTATPSPTATSTAGPPHRWYLYLPLVVKNYSDGQR
jgi:hypothetical protein